MEDVVACGGEVEKVLRGALAVGSEEDAHRRLAQRLEADGALGLARLKRLGLRALHGLDNLATLLGRGAVESRERRRRADGEETRRAALLGLHLQLIVGDGLAVGRSGSPLDCD